MKIKEKHTYTIPSYAISALINGDYSGLEGDDEKNLKGFLKRESYIDEWDVDSDQDPSFTSHPEFGLACDCVEVTGIVWDKNKENDPEKEDFNESFYRGHDKIEVPVCLVYFYEEDDGKKIYDRETMMEYLNDKINKLESGNNENI